MCLRIQTDLVLRLAAVRMELRTYLRRVLRLAAVLIKPLAYVRTSVLRLAADLIRLPAYLGTYVCYARSRSPYRRRLSYVTFPPMNAGHVGCPRGLAGYLWSVAFMQSCC